MQHTDVYAIIKGTNVQLAKHFKPTIIY